MAMPPASMPPQAEGPGESEQGHEGGDPTAGASGKDLIIGVHSGLAKVVALAAKAGAPEDIVAELKSSLDSFKSAMSKLMGAGGGGGPQPADAGSASPEQGGNPNAVPMG